MSTSIVMSEKKKALIAYKEKILKELEYYDSRIEEISSSKSKSSFIEEINSSDSEADFPLSVDLGPSVPQLKQQQSSLKICVLATQELTSLQVLQSEVNVLVEDPVFVGEPAVSESGVWREVTAECRVDLVPFSISFYVHQPDRQFGSRCYRGVRTVPVRAAHAAELAPSVLAAATTPSDAVQVIKSYASGHRSRRTTLARLAAKYNDSLHMEPMPEGGYFLKCANLLEISWTLQNKWSPIAPFHHRMKFNLEYMDESYIKIIAQTHRQLSDPSIETDERTFLLSKIISTCLEAQGPTQELYESMSSDPETAQSLRQRRTTLDQEPEQPIVPRNKDREVMAPPKSLPKKAKPKGKENVVENRKTKRVTEDHSKAKKARLDKVNDELKSDKKNKKNERESDRNNDLTNNDNSEKDSDKISPKSKEVEQNIVAKQKNTESAKSKKIKSTIENKKVENVKKTADDKDIKNKGTNNEKEKDVAKVKKNIDTNKESIKPKDIVNTKNVASDKVKRSTKPMDSNEKVKKVSSKETVSTEKSNKNTVNKLVKNIVNAKNNVAAKKDAKTTKVTKKQETTKKVASKEPVTVEKSDKIVRNKIVNSNTEGLNNNNENKENPETIPFKSKSADVNTNKAVKNKIYKVTNNANKDKPKSITSKISVETTDINKIAEDNNIASSKEVSTNVQKDKVNNKQDKVKTKAVVTKKDKPTKIVESKVTTKEDNTQNINTDKEMTIEKAVEKKSSLPKRKSNLADKDIDTNVATTKKPKLSKPESPKEITNVEDDVNKHQNMKPTNKISRNAHQKPKFITNSMKTLKTGNIQRVFNSGNISKQSSERASKIPQKKLSSVSETTLKKNPLRISPRKIPSKFKTPATIGHKYIVAQKTTSIPRLMKKPYPKT